MLSPILAPLLTVVLAADILPTPPPAPPPPPIPAAATVDESCEPLKLAPYLSAPKTRQIENEMELDRRYAAALAEQRRVEAEATEAQTKATSAAEATARGLWMHLLLGLVGVALGVAGARRKSVALALAALALVGAGGFFHARLTARHAELLASHDALANRLFALSECKNRIADTRKLLMHSRVANCTHDLSEADEDVWGWITRMKSGGAMVGVPELQKMHDEIRASLKY